MGARSLTSNWRCRSSSTITRRMPGPAEVGYVRGPTISARQTAVYLRPASHFWQSSATGVRAVRMGSDARAVPAARAIPSTRQARRSGIMADLRQRLDGVPGPNGSRRPRPDDTDAFSATGGHTPARVNSIRVKVTRRRAGEKEPRRWEMRRFPTGCGGSGAGMPTQSPSSSGGSGRRSGARSASAGRAAGSSVSSTRKTCARR